jgi:hypothetical protein
MTEEAHVNDIGSIFRTSITEDGQPVDLTTATVMKIKFEKKNRETFEVDAVLTLDEDSNPVPGKMEYITVDGDLDIKGKWKVQGYVELAGGWKGHSAIGTFIVSSNIQIIEV